MTGAQALAKLERRLGLHAVTDERYDPPFLFDALSEARDKIVRVFAQGAPIVVQKATTLDAVGTPDTDYEIPSAERDPYRILEVRSVTNAIPLRPSLNTDDAGDYMWITLRILRISTGVTPPGGPEIVWVPSWADINEDTTAAQIGLPSTCHMAVVKGAVVEVLSTDAEVDIKEPFGQFQMELQDLENTYAEFDALGGIGMREAFLATYGQWLGDMVY